MARSRSAPSLDPMGKGETTRARIIDEAIRVASVEGLAGLTIGRLAERTRMSKSGLFAHFESREAVEVAVLEQAIGRFRDTVILAALREARGEPRVRAIVERWHDWATDNATMPGGCLLLQAAVEVDDRPGPCEILSRTRCASGARCSSARRRLAWRRGTSVPISIRRCSRSSSRESSWRLTSRNVCCVRRARPRGCAGRWMR